MVCEQCDGASGSRDLEHCNERFHEVTNAGASAICCSTPCCSLHHSTSILTLLRLAQLVQGSLALCTHGVAQRSDEAHAGAGVECIDGDTAEQRAAPANEVKKIKTGFSVHTKFCAMAPIQPEDTRMHSTPSPQHFKQPAISLRAHLPAATWHRAAAAVDSTVSPLSIMLQLC
jgi:hypothetical protein